MFSSRLAKKIERCGLLEASRRVLFTASPKSSINGPFELEYFYQFGSCVIAKENGVIYGITASHVVRNATKNQYMNESPFWVTPNIAPHLCRHQDVLYPMRYYDFSPNGEDEFDVGIMEFSATIFNLGLTIDLDDPSSFIQPQELQENITAAVSGYPEYANPYVYKEDKDQNYQQLATVKREYFRGTISSGSDGLFFHNLTIKRNCSYSGLSGGIVVCCINNSIPKPLGIVISSGMDGSIFRIIPFHEIKSKSPKFEDLEWDVIDEAYFFNRKITHSQMKYEDFIKCMKMNSCEYTPKRTNNYIKQIYRTLKKDPDKYHYLETMCKGREYEIIKDLVIAINNLITTKAVSLLKN